ncbi:alpha/beta hydrolase fold domain-containing protein, partial [Candidatus Falkowbacteria bacterium]|nr:alpha/beta hydrolase fold domain-containing protein [Candidatus Falkowbacteria bacterium]
CEDLDGDGHANPICGGDDCDDTNPDINPGEDEICGDGIDNDCDGVEPNPGGPCTVGIGSCAETGIYICDPNDLTADPICDAPTPQTPQPEICDGIDNDCDWDIDEDDVCCVPDCSISLTPGNFEMTEEWNWDGSGATNPTYNQVMMTPMVADLDLDGMPEILFNTYTGSGYNANLILRAIHGNDGSSYFDYNGTTAGREIAVGDIDNDSYPEVIVRESDGTFVALEHNGTFKWQSITSAGRRPMIADLDGDGTPEIIGSASVLNNDGTSRWIGGGGAVANLDMSGRPEVLSGCQAYSYDGTILYDVCGTYPNGFVAVANLDSEPLPEIITVVGGVIRAFENDFTFKWAATVSGVEGGGPPVVANFDTDPEPEIGVAGASIYVVLEADGTLKWSSPTVDASSRSTGSSVFDFNNDGQAEILYNDEYNFRVYNGSDGTILSQIPNGSGTLNEYPVIVDVDNDNEAEIVLAANDYVHGSNTGIRVFGNASTEFTWVDTRSIWNQHSYHITNVFDDGTIPVFEPNNWETFNNYRCNNSVNAPVGGEKQCGDDGCGGVCGICTGGTTCVNGFCEFACVPDCNGAECGDDGCGGSCGTCSGSENCCSGSCQVPTCSNNSECNDSDSCTTDTCNNPGSCSASCSNAQVTNCQDGDGCCPGGCDSGNDNDCAPAPLGPCEGDSNIIYGGETYDLVEIDTQCWFRENLNVGTMLASVATMPSDPAPTIGDPDTVQKWCYDNDDSPGGNCDTYGGLYTWAEANQLTSSCNSSDCQPAEPNQGICPPGWHIPSDTEYKTLVEFYGGVGCESGIGWQCDPAGTELKTVASDKFSGFPTGYRHPADLFSSDDSSALFWSSSESLSDISWYRNLHSTVSTVERRDGAKTTGFSIRCIKDNTAVESIPPVVNLFNATANGNDADIFWNVSDAGGSHLNRVEIWRAFDQDGGGTKSPWNEVTSLEQIVSGGLDNHSGSTIDTPGQNAAGNYNYWYRVRVYDNDGNETWSSDSAMLILGGVPCIPDGCNSTCPISCTVAQDPDCGCQDSNSCCGIGCNGANDNDCFTTPVINSFNVTRDTNNVDINISWDVIQSGGSLLDKITVYRSLDSGGAPDGNWVEIKNISVENINATSHIATVTDTPGNGTFWYGMHATDQLGTDVSEPPPGAIQMNIIANATNVNCYSIDLNNPSNPINPHHSDGYLDIYTPSTGSNFPVFVYIHGGGWCLGDKTDQSDIITYLRDNGYAVISLNYGLAKDGYVYPSQLHDIDCALRWINVNSGTYSLDLSRLYMGGYSAGGHLALLYSLNQDIYRDPSCCNTTPSPTIEKIVSIAGPTDFETIDFSATGDTCDILPGPVQWQFDDAFLRPESSSIDRRIAASPRTYLYSANPAISTNYLMIYSDTDTYVNFALQALPFYVDMANNGFNVQNIWYSGFDHNFADSTTPGHNADQVKIDTLNFLNGCSTTEIDCFDGVDNDCDGDVDGVDSDCFVGVDSTLPSVSSFSISSIDYTVTDSGGSHLSRVEIWIAPDNNGTPGAWKELENMRRDITLADLDYYIEHIPYIIPDGHFWYGLHVIDQDGNCVTEKNEDCTTGASNGNPPLSPVEYINCSNNEGATCPEGICFTEPLNCSDGYDNDCDGLIDLNDPNCYFLDDFLPEIVFLNAILVEGERDEVSLRWQLFDRGGSHLSSFKLSRGMAGADGTIDSVLDWTNFYNINNLNTDNYLSLDEVIEQPGDGTWWYKLEVDDHAGNIRIEYDDITLPGPIPGCFMWSTYELYCNNGRDDDCDGLLDLDDKDNCDCLPTDVEICDNGIDDDCDDAIDAVDLVDCTPKVTWLSVSPLSYSIIAPGGSPLKDVLLKTSDDINGNPSIFDEAAWSEITNLTKTFTANQNIYSYNADIPYTIPSGGALFFLQAVNYIGNTGYALPAVKECMSSETNCSDGIDNDCDTYIDSVDFDCGTPSCTPDGCNSICPANCTVSEDPDCGCQGGNSCCPGGCNSSNDSDCVVPCSPDGCNGNCPTNCTIAQDPDCGCQGGNSCCPGGCNSSNDSDCVVPDTTNPVVNPFNANLTSVSYVVTDAGGLNRVEIWMAPDSGGTPGAWSENVSLRRNTTATSYSQNISYNTPVGIWWYGLHAIDQAGNCTTESNKDCTTGISNGNPSFGPIKINNCTVAESDCFDGIDNDCDGPVDAADPDCDTSPTIGSFAATVNGADVKILWNVTDNSGSQLDRIDVYRAPDVANNPGTWINLPSLNVINLNTGNHVETNKIDQPGDGTWWYKIRVTDQASNTKESSFVKVVVSFCTATETNCSDGIDNDCDGPVDAADPDCAPACIPDGCNSTCPANCTISEDPDCGCQAGNSCCPSGCFTDTDNDCLALDITKAVIETFDIWITLENVDITFDVSDAGGSYLDYIMIERAFDGNGPTGSPPVAVGWNEVVSLRKTFTTNEYEYHGHQSEAPPAPSPSGNYNYWYRLVIYDRAGNRTTHTSPMVTTNP